MENNNSLCPQTGLCGGCAYQGTPYAEQLKIKDQQLKELFDSVGADCHYMGILSTDRPFEYKNKMEFSFGDSCKNGPLQLGMHKKRSFYDIVSAKDCQLVDGDYRKIVEFTESFFAERNATYMHKKSHRGFLRHLLIRKGMNTGEILIDLVTTSQDDINNYPYAEGLLALDLEGEIVGILHTKNDSLADAVKDEGTTVLYGRDYFYEKLLGLTFKISPFSFFQTNSYGAELLYSTVREFAKDIKCNTMFDLYSGTGTIAQILSAVANEVIGVEIIPEAVEAAKENAKLNNLDNCRFIAGDVGEVMDSLPTNPELIILDPPRDGIHPKAIRKIINFGADTIIYVSCKPASLARDLKILTGNGYEVIKTVGVDQFPQTSHCEAVCLLSRMSN